MNPTRIGQRLAIVATIIAVPAAASAAIASPARHPANGCADTYTVAPGDTMAGIARTHGYEPGALNTDAWHLFAAINTHIEDPALIRPGDELCLTVDGITAPPTIASAPTISVHPDEVVGDARPPHALGMPTIEAIAVAFDGLGLDVVDQAITVARCESSLNPNAHRTTNSPARLTGDLGLFQLNHVHTPDLVAAGIITERADLFDPLANARAARHLYNAQGWRPWYKSASCTGL